MVWCTTVAMAQSGSDIYQDFKDVKHVTALTLPRALIRLGSKSVKDNNIQAVLQEIDKVQILDMDKCSKSKRKKLVKAVEALSSNGYETFTQLKDQKQNIKIFGKQSGENISEIVLLANDDDSCVFTLIKGKINPEDLSAVIGIVEDY